MPSDEERRAYEKVVDGLDRPRRERQDHVEVTRIDDPQSSGEAVPKAFLIESPEPIDWTQTSLTASYAAEEDVASESVIPDRVKISEATVDTQAAVATDESVTLLLHEALSLSGCAIEYRRNTEPQPTVFDPTLVREQYREDFVTEGLNRYDTLFVEAGLCVRACSSWWASFARCPILTRRDRRSGTPPDGDFLVARTSANVYYVLTVSIDH